MVDTPKDQQGMPVEIVRYRKGALAAMAGFLGSIADGWVKVARGNGIVTWQNVTYVTTTSNTIR